VSLDQLCVNTIRMLAMNAVPQANSGHPGTPMAIAPAVCTLWQRALRFDTDLGYRDHHGTRVWPPAWALGKAVSRRRQT